MTDHRLNPSSGSLKNMLSMCVCVQNANLEGEREEKGYQCGPWGELSFHTTLM